MSLTGILWCFFFQAEDGIRDIGVTGVQTCALPIWVTFNGNGMALPAAPEIAVEQPPGTDLVDGVSTNDFGSVAVGASTSLTFTIKNTGTADLTILGFNIDGTDTTMFILTAIPSAPVSPGGSTTFTVQFAPSSPGLKTAA